MTDPVESIDFAGGRLAVVREPQVERALPLPQAIQELAATLRSTPEDQLLNAPRVRVVPRQRGAVWLHSLRAALPLAGLAGGKDYTSIGFETPALWVTVVSLRSGLPIALIEADYLSRVRTAAVTAVATDLLAPSTPRTLAHFGVGKISELLVRALLEVRPSLERVLLVRRQAELPPPEWVTHLPPAVEVQVVSADAALEQAEVVTTATNSKTPVIPAGARLPLLRHLNLVGSNLRDRREIDGVVLARLLPPAGFLAVDDREQARLEAGELIAAGPAVAWEEVPSLAEVARDLSRRERVTNAPVTVFKSVGVGVMDLAIAAVVLKRLGLLPQAD